MKHRPKTKLEKRKKFGEDVMSANIDVIVFFLIHGQFGAIQKPNFGYMVCNTYIFIRPFILQELKAEPKTVQHSSHTVTLSKRFIFLKIC